MITIVVIVIIIITLTMKLIIIIMLIKKYIKFKKIMLMPLAIQYLNNLFKNTINILILIYKILEIEITWMKKTMKILTHLLIILKRWKKILQK